MDESGGTRAGGKELEEDDLGEGVPRLQEGVGPL
jgi:hypothetical protein